MAIFNHYREKFKDAMQKECEAHYKEGNYKLIKRDELPEGATLLSSVWQMKRKRKPSTGEISKYKALQYDEPGKLGQYQYLISVY